MNRIVKFLLPFFPDSTFLKKHWWHRLALIIALATSSLLTLVAILSLVVVLFAKSGSSELSLDLASCIFTPKLSIEDFGKQLKLKHIQYTTRVSSSDSITGYAVRFNTYDSLSDYEAGILRLKEHPEDYDKIEGYNCLNKVEPFFVSIAVIAILTGLFSVNLIYRIFLYITLNNEWK